MKPELPLTGPLSRRTVLEATASLLATVSLTDGSWAQDTTKVFRIGFISSSTTSVSSPFLVAFRQALGEAGYTEGRNLVIEYRLATSRRAFLHPDPSAVVTPPIYIAFDCVQASGRDLREHPLGARREVLERLIADHHLLFPARRLPAHGLAAWAGR